jgi:hypothetical protein
MRVLHDARVADSTPHRRKGPQPSFRSSGPLRLTMRECEKDAPSPLSLFPVGPLDGHRPKRGGQDRGGQPGYHTGHVQQLPYPHDRPDGKSPEMLHMPVAVYSRATNCQPTVRPRATACRPILRLGASSCQPILCRGPMPARLYRPRASACQPLVRPRAHACQPEVCPKASANQPTVWPRTSACWPVVRPRASACR